MDMETALTLLVLLVSGVQVARISEECNPTMATCFSPFLNKLIKRVMTRCQSYTAQITVKLHTFLSLP